MKFKKKKKKSLLIVNGRNGFLGILHLYFVRARVGGTGRAHD
jgi:hypothetical protein